MRIIRQAPGYFGAILVSAVLLVPSPVQAITIDLGASFSQPVVETRPIDSNTKLAESASPSSIWPSISFQSKERYFGDSNWGYSLSAMAWYYSVDQQKDGGGDFVDYNTAIEGYYAYLTPTIYYRFGDKHVMQSKDKWNWSVGIGLGIGYLVAHGNVYTNYSSTKTTEQIDINNGAVSSGLFIEAVKNRWFVRFSSYGPESDNSDRKLKVRLSDNTLTIGKRFELRELFQ
jgi:hypothetical protein